MVDLSSIMNLSSYTWDNSVLEDYWLNFGVYTLLVSFQCIVILKLLKRHKENTEPVHIFQINLLVDLMFLTCCRILRKDII